MKYAILSAPLMIFCAAEKLSTAVPKAKTSAEHKPMLDLR